MSEKKMSGKEREDLTRFAFSRVRVELENASAVALLDALESAMIDTLRAVNNVEALVTERHEEAGQERYANIIPMFACDPDPSCGQDSSKHPGYHSLHADLWDNRPKGDDAA